MSGKTTHLFLSYKQHKCNGVQNRRQHACPPAQQHRGVGGTQIPAACGPEIRIAQFCQVKRHIGTAQQVSRQNHNQITHARRLLFGFYPVYHETGGLGSGFFLPWQAYFIGKIQRMFFSKTAEKEAAFLTAYGRYDIFMMYGIFSFQN